MAQTSDTIKFLSLDGLTYYDGKIKEYINAGDTTLDNKIDALKAEDIAVEWDEQDPVSTSTDVQGALDEIFDAIAENAEAGEVAVYTNVQGTPTKVDAIHADGSTYTIKQGTTKVADINIARDMVVSSGSVITATGLETDVPTGVTLTSGEKYVRLVIANATDGKNIYIAVNDLYDDYTFTDGDEIDFTESGNEVSAEIKSGSIAKTKLTTALQNEITSARTTITEVAQTDPATKHILVTKTAGTGATADNYVISESDIASASDLTAEVTRAQAAEGEIAGKIGLTGNEGSKVYSSNVGGSTVTADINTLDGRLDDVETFIGNITAITNTEINGLFTTPSSGD